MKNLLLFIVMVCIMLFPTCKKDPQKSDCEVNKYGTLTLNNTTVNTFNLYLDNQLIAQINAKTTLKIKIPEGNNRILEAVQVGGSDEYSMSFNVIACSEYNSVIQ